MACCVLASCLLFLGYTLRHFHYTVVLLVATSVCANCLPFLAILNVLKDY